MEPKTLLFINTEDLRKFACPFNKGSSTFKWKLLKKVLFDKVKNPRVFCFLVRSNDCFPYLKNVRLVIPC